MCWALHFTQYQVISTTERISK